MGFFLPLIIYSILKIYRPNAGIIGNAKMVVNTLIGKVWDFVLTRYL